jgi:oligoendopeptidase F
MRKNFNVWIVLTVLLTILLATSAFSQTETIQQGELPDQSDRDNIPEQYKWDLSHIYTGWEAWEADLGNLQTSMDKFAGFKGRLNEGPSVLVEIDKLSDELGLIAYKAYSYVSLMGVTDMRNTDFQTRQQQIGTMFFLFGQATSWLTPEMIEIGEETVMKWVDETPELNERRFEYEETFRQQKHILDAVSEQLLSYYGQLQSAPSSIYDMLSTADVEFPEVTLSNGETITATHGAYGVAKEKYRNQADREAVFKAHFSTIDNFENTYAAIYNGMLQSQVASMKARNYESTAEMSLSGENIPVEVMENLVATAKNGSAPLQRYNKIRKEVMGLERYRYFDMYTPLVEIEWDFPYDDIKPQILKSIKVFGDEYVAKATRAFDERWFDVYENEGKRSGAFSAGVYGVHPYMLLNHTDTMNDAFTLAHELGHTMHTVLADETQPFHSSNYSLFVAEVASTMNEALFLDVLLKDTKDTNKRIALLEHAINGIHGTFYRQAMFADFELKMHKAAQDGKPINAATLQELYLESLNAFFGDSLDDQDWYKNTWARISHYMRPYYVYQYATSIATSSQFHKLITEGKKKDRRKATATYLDLLKSGGKDHPVNLIRTAGVDWATPAAAEAMVEKMDALVTQLEKELKKLGMLEG